MLDLNFKKCLFQIKTNKKTIENSTKSGFKKKENKKLVYIQPFIKSIRDSTASKLFDV